MVGISAKLMVLRSLHGTLTLITDSTMPDENKLPKCQKRKTFLKILA
jgi:hypothetical protein